MREELHDRVMREVSTVEWPDGRVIRKRAGRRRARRVVAGCAAVVAVFALAWTVVPPIGDGGSPRPADDRRTPAPGTLRAEDLGPGFEINSWASYRDTEASDDRSEEVVEWPPTWLTGCPAYRAAPPVGFRGHRGGSAVRADPTTATGAVPVNEFVMRFTDGVAAQAVLDEVRQIGATCATYDVGGRQRYTATVAARNFAGDQAVRLDLTGVGVDPATGGTAGVPGLEVYVLVQVARMVILLTASGPVEPAWLQGLAPVAVDRLCTETDEC